MSVGGPSPDQAGEAAALRFLGHAQRGLGQLADARNSWTTALRILSELDEPEHARQIETEIASLAVGKSLGEVAR